MRLRGRYKITLNGEQWTAYNDVTNEGLETAAWLMANPVAPEVIVGVKDDTLAAPTDTLEKHEWFVVSNQAPATLTAEKNLLTTEKVSLTASQEGVVGGCYLVVNGKLFSVASFEPRGVVEGDHLLVQYQLELLNS